MSSYTPILTESPSNYGFESSPDYMKPQPQRYSNYKNLSLPLTKPTLSNASEATCIDEPTDSKPWADQSRVWIPATREPNYGQPRARTIVLCFDGTGDQFDGDNSNVVQLLAMLKKDDHHDQLVYYQAGIGTYTDPLFALPVSNGVSLILDQMLAWNLGSHVKDGYAYLMQNYQRGDKICIFGFSRGAYTARALAGMLHKVGLLPIYNHQQLPFAYEMYVREDEEGLTLSHMFKKTFCRDVSVEFLGVWDTVASVGLLPKYLPFVHENTGIRYLRHALALDERRVKFLPQFCVDPPKPKIDEPTPNPSYTQANFHRHAPERARTLTKAYEDLVNSRNTVGKSDVQEVWFAGVHTDVGGGSVANGTRYSLARIPLRWMIRELFKCDTGIIFDAAQLQQAGLRIVMKEDCPVLTDLPPRIKGENGSVQPLMNGSNILQSLGTLFKAAVVYSVFMFKLFFTQKKVTVGSIPFSNLDHPEQLVDQIDDHEANEEYYDALSPMNDQLQVCASWHLLEWIPQRIKKAKAIIHKIEDGNSYKWLWNRGRGRKIPKSEMKEGLKIHRSVKTRLEASEMLRTRYVPQVRPWMKRFDEHGNKLKIRDPRPLTFEEWNVDQPEHWEWVD
ncbi:hypothetical protein ABKN59_002783 [Abortiporus biennis]